MKRFRFNPFFYLITLFTVFILSNQLSGQTCISLFDSILLENYFTTNNLSKTSKVIALGLDSKESPLQKFAKEIEKKIKNKVVIYKNFEEANYTSLTGAWWNDGTYEEITSVVELAIRRAIDQHPNKKIIVFNLDNYDPAKFFDKDGRENITYTNFEIKLLLSEPHLFQATRWFLNGKELSHVEIMKYFGDLLLVLRKNS